MSFFKKILRRKEGDSSLKKAKTKEIIEDAVVAPKPQEAKGGSRVFKKNTGVHGILRASHITEKTSVGAKENKYVFSVFPSANKIQIKHAVEAYYGVGVRAVNILNTQGKVRKRGGQVGFKPGFKKATVKLQEGQSIEI